MHYMVELTHGPDTCIAAKNQAGDPNAELLKHLHDTARSHRAKLVGGWSFPVGHRLWYVFEADSAHVVADICNDSRLHHWNTVEVYPVLEHELFKRTVLDQLGATQQSFTRKTAPIFASL